jgi:hypothetical protein
MLANEICGLLGYYAVSCRNCLPTFRDNVSVPSSRVKSPSRKACPETTLKNYHTTSRNTPEDRRFHQHHGGSLKSKCWQLWCTSKHAQYLVTIASSIISRNITNFAYSLVALHTAAVFLPQPASCCMFCNSFSTTALSSCVLCTTGSFFWAQLSTAVQAVSCALELAAPWLRKCAVQYRLLMSTEQVCTSCEGVPLWAVHTATFQGCPVD